ncbi:helicase SWR1-like [Camellia sinensis]|uniref:helicase SWR1-like n=1 Tax=Camellia sinensis TaxID=4442 RepID=UPI0010367792|nr:helicase SWR1-like [Camellia sinensis]
MEMFRWMVDTPEKFKCFRREFSIPADVHLSSSIAGEGISTTIRSQLRFKEAVRSPCAEAQDASSSELHTNLQAIQHAHSYAVKTEMTRKELVKKTKEAAKLLSSLNQAEAKNRALLDQAKASKAAQDLAEEKAKKADAEAEAARADLEAVKAKIANLEAKMQAALDSKEPEVKATDEKAFEEGQAAVRDQYKGQLQAPFPPEPKDSGDEVDEDDTEDDEADEVEEEAATDAKFPTLNEQIDLTQDEEDDLVSKGVSPKPTTSEAEVQCAKRSLDQTLLEIDIEIAVEKNATPPAEVEKSQTNPST